MLNGDIGACFVETCLVETSVNGGDIGTCLMEASVHASWRHWSMLNGDSSARLDEHANFIDVASIAPCADSADVVW
jgi:hypothetical protein